MRNAPKYAFMTTCDVAGYLAGQIVYCSIIPEWEYKNRHRCKCYDCLYSFKDQDMYAREYSAIDDAIGVAFTEHELARIEIDVGLVI